MRLQVSEDGARAFISGDFTFADHNGFKEMMTKLLAANQPSIVIDLSSLDFIDSAGLGMLLLVRDEAGKASRALTLKGPHGQVKRLFDLTKFDTLFAIEQ